MSKVGRFYPGVIGMELTADAPTVTTIRTGNESTPENLAAARLQFPEARRVDFAAEAVAADESWSQSSSSTELLSSISFAATF